MRKGFVQAIGMVLIAASMQAVSAGVPAHAAATNGSLYFNDHCPSPCSPINAGGKQYVQMDEGAGSNLFNFESTTAFTFEVWTKLDRSMGTGYGDLFGGPSWIVQVDNAGNTGITGNTGGFFGGVVIPGNTWAHYALVHYADKTVVEYVNGVAKSKTTNIAANFGGTGHALYLGDGAGSVTHSIKGNMSNFRAAKTAVYGTSAVAVNDTVFNPQRIPFEAVQSAGDVGSNVNQISSGQTSALLKTLYDGGDTSTAIADSSGNSLTVKSSDQAGQRLNTQKDVPGPSPRAISPFLSISSSSENGTAGQAITGYSTLPNSETYTATYGGTAFASLTTGEKNGLTFDSVTGKISGVPTSTASAKTFVIKGSTSTAGATFTLTVTAGQTITFPTVSGLTEGDSKVLIATASSGLAVTYSSSTPNVCSVSGGTVKTVAGGTCTLVASQSGDATYSAAPNVSVTFGVAFSAKKNDEEDAIVLALAGVAVGVASMMADVTTLATKKKSCYRGKIVKKVLSGKSCPKGYSTKKPKATGS